MKVYKKIISLLLVLLLLFGSLSAMPFSASASEELVTDDGTYQIQIDAFGKVYIFAATIDEADLVIPSEILGHTITGIHAYAFSDNENIKSVTIPDTIKHIGPGAFSGCTQLIDIKINNECCNVSDDAFSNTAWYNAQPDGIVYLNDYLCLGYKGTEPEEIDEIVIKEGTKVIADNAFRVIDSKNIEHINIPSTVEVIGLGAFVGTLHLKSVVISGDCTIGNFAFSMCPYLKSVTMSAGIKGIDKYAFSGYLHVNQGTPMEDLIIYGYADTFAEEFANEFEYKFVDLAKGTIGDCDKDEKITVKDATLIQKHVAKITTIDDTTLDYTDVNGDGTVNVKDATTIQKYVAKVIDSFAVGF